MKELQFEYEIENEDISKETFFDKAVPFNPNSKTEMIIMMNEICQKLNLTEEYPIKKLEVMLKYELPFFATTRNLARNWMVENFIF